MPPRIIKNIERSFKDMVFFLLRLILRKGDRSRWPLKPKDISSLLVLRPDKLGDMIATVPAIHAVKKMFPHIRIEIMASPRNCEIIAADPALDGRPLYTKNIFRDGPMIRALRKKEFDIIYDPICHDSLTGLLLVKMIGRKSLKAASRKLRFREFYDFCEPYQPDGDDHNIDNGMLIFKVLGVDPETVDPLLPIFIPESSEQKAAAFLQMFEKSDGRLMGINISAGSLSRTLSLDKYAAIMSGIGKRQQEMRFVIICTMEDREKGLALLKTAEVPAALVPEDLSLLDVAAILKRLDFLISPDTSLVHIAGLMKIPVVGLYSGHERNYHFWKPYRQGAGAVVAGNIHNLHDIEPSQVIEEFNRLLRWLEKDRQATVISAGEGHDSGAR